MTHIIFFLKIRARLELESAETNLVAQDKKELEPILEESH